MIFNYTTKAMQRMPAHKLGCLYMNAYTLTHSQHKSASNLDVFQRATEVLRGRSFEELQPLYHFLRDELRRSTKTGSADRMREKHGMLNHFHYNVLEG